MRMLRRRAWLLALGLLAAPQAEAREPPGSAPAKPAEAGRNAASAPARPKPTRPTARAPDGPALHPVDREQIQAWLEANPDWTPPRATEGSRPVEGRRLPADVAGRRLPPDLAMRLPYFPGYRYVPVGPDLALVATASGHVAALLAGAFAR